MPIRTHLIVAVEIAAGLSALILVALWISEPSGPYESFLAATGLFTTAAEAFRRYQGRLFKTEGVERTPSERVQHHEKLRRLFREEIDRCRAEKLRKDVIIRHVNRLDSYPEARESNGISPWFKLGLLDTYHAGIKVGLGWEDLVESPSGLRKQDCKKGEQGALTVMLMGEIPYDYIETMNADGDEYYYLPHIYCHFANKGEPYERLYYAEKVDMGHGHEFWKELLSYADVALNTEQHKSLAGGA